MFKLTRKNLPYYWELMRLNKPIGIWLVLWPAVWALFFAAQGIPDLGLMIIFSIGAFLMRSAGCVINDYADRHWDGKVERTRERPLASGKVAPNEALQLFVLLCGCASILLLFLDSKTRIWSLGALALASFYPFTKRFTYFPQLFLGAAFSWSIPMAFVAQAGQTDTTTWLLFAAVVLWVLVYDTFYAMVDRKDDLAAGIKSTAIRFGSQSQIITSTLQIAFLLLMLALGLIAESGMAFYASLAIVAGLFIYQQQLLSSGETEKYFRAFLNNNYVGMAVFVGVALDQTLPALIT